MQTPKFSWLVPKWSSIKETLCSNAAHMTICNVQDIWNDNENLDVEEHNLARWLCGVCKLYFSLLWICVLLKSFLSEGGSKSARCDDLASLRSRNCPLSKIENPRGSVVPIKNVNVTNRKKGGSEKVKPEQITQIQPQKLTMTLRSGK